LGLFVQWLISFPLFCLLHAFRPFAVKFFFGSLLAACVTPSV
jgi:hypothetical protein